jgi:hypothetical protein
MAGVDRLHLMVDCTGTALPSDRVLALLTEDVRELRHHLAEHFMWEESGGYLDSVTKRRPELSERVAELRNQHAEFLRLFDAALRSPELAELRRVTSEVLTGLRAHEAAENELVHEAAVEELGVAG